MRILVTGAHGLLGSEFVRLGAARGDGWDVLPYGRSALDVTDAEQARRIIGNVAPDWVVHCAAYTAVDRAESEPELAMRVNRDGTAHVASAARSAGAGLVAISTDYVFGGDGARPYRPEDPVAPQSVYAVTKRAGEEAALDEGGLVARIGWLYGAGGRDFIDAILERARKGERLRIVNDQRGRPTWARNVAETVVELLEAGAEPGVWHVADRGEATWLELAREALALSGVEAEVEGVSTESWGAPAPRPRYSVLDLSATEERLGRPLERWPDALRRFLHAGEA